MNEKACLCRDNKFFEGNLDTMNTPAGTTTLPLDSKTTAQPYLPLLACAVVTIISSLTSFRANWLADGVAIVLAFSIAQAGLGLAQKSGLMTSSMLRWTVLVVAMTMAVTGGVAIESWLWPQLTPAHAVWVLPAVIILFLSVTVLPVAIDLEVRHKAQASLLAEAGKHLAERQMLEARLAALQGQIEPHFLFNTLANARALIHQDANQAGKMLNHLIAYLRAAMPDMRLTTTTLGQELDRAAAYLEIFQIRLGARFQFSVQATESVRRYLIPPLAVMSLVENAIKHGIEPQPGEVRIDIHADCSAGMLQIAVRDNGRGFQGELGSGVGLLNVQERLLALFGGQAELRLTPMETGGVSAELALPARTQEQT